jgi:hypothetical protein
VGFYCVTHGGPVVQRADSRRRGRAMLLVARQGRDVFLGACL